MLVEQLHPERVLDRNPLFDILFNSITPAEAALDTGDLHFRPVEYVEPQSNFSMTM
jgi:hypothetical protein